MATCKPARKPSVGAVLVKALAQDLLDLALWEIYVYWKVNVQPMLLVTATFPDSDSFLHKYDGKVLESVRRMTWHNWT